MPILYTNDVSNWIQNKFLELMEKPENTYAIEQYKEAWNNHRSTLQLYLHNLIDKEEFNSRSTIAFQMRANLFKLFSEDMRHYILNALNLSVYMDEDLDTIFVDCNDYPVSINVLFHNFWHLYFSRFED